MRAALTPDRSGNHLAMVVLAAIVLASIPASGATSRWGANYFPNVSLQTQDGNPVRFFDDLIKDKIVAINFIYTTCADTCPLETAQLVKVQQILGDRMGREIFFYSITIDPDHDTPPVLKEYRERFGANWTFLTGQEADIISLRRKLGLYIEEIQDGTNNHNVSMIIGNQATGRWMKRSPFENPYVLADQLGNWLNDWKTPSSGGDYANAPELRNITPGEQLYRTRCATCHTISGEEVVGALGPDLLGVTQRREMGWLINWLRAPDQMLEAKDPIALQLFEQYNQLAMPNMRLNQQEAQDLIEYMALQGQPHDGRHSGERALSVSVASPDSNPDRGRVVAIIDAWVRETDEVAPANGGYMTLVNAGPFNVTLAAIECEGFEKVEVHEMVVVDGMMKMREVKNLVIPANGHVQMQPGGKHLMLVGPSRHFRNGQQLELKLIFASGSEQIVSLDVLARTRAEP
jgi:copper(I)-binding protein/cytochrome oxidase Cu insertion factor (SCO1/SenC/PrrC family)